ncbi:MAG: response regulator transcription factor [Chloroflexota bacterium]|nr:response regulator transcription factor [Chloroflexota bacterium]
MEWQPDVVVLDCQLPGMSGPQVAAEMQRQGPSAKVLAPSTGLRTCLSSYSDDRYVRGMLEAGAVGYLLKSEAPEVIVEAVRAAGRGVASPAGLEAFRTANWQMAHDLAKQQRSLDVTVVLNQPLSVDEFTELVDKYGLQVYGFQMRVIDGHGDRVTLFSSPDSDQLVPEYSLVSMLGRVQDQTGEAKFLGVTTIDAGLSSSNFDILSADPAVFLMDVTPGFAEHHMRQQHASLLEAGDFVTTSAYPVYWYLESNQQSQP